MESNRSVHVTIPVKGLGGSKSRLSGLFQPSDRARLTITMLKDVVNAVRGSKVVSGIVVISPDSEVLKVAEWIGVDALLEDKFGLNNAIEQAAAWRIRSGRDPLLILPSDIPLVEAGDVDRLAGLASEPCSIVVSSSKDGGTNALLLHPPDAIPPRFGPDSFRRHLEEAATRGIEARVYKSPRVSRDIDSEDDVRRFMSKPNGTLTYALLRELGFTVE